jgi:hypothetical protein
MDDWPENEIDALDRQLERGEIDHDTHWRLVTDLKREAEMAKDHQDITDAGRGHLLK